MREGDPPPYLARMRQLGYPPGYMGDPDERPAEEAPLALYATPAEATAGEAAGDDQDAAVARAPRREVPLVAFPGLNVPPPPGANLAAWGW